MRLSRKLKLTGALAVCVLAAPMMIAGCHASAEVSTGVKTPPPPPPPPPADQDGDGVADPDDKCPDQKEDGKAPDPQDGCPNVDEDLDGVPIPQDKCPDKAETKNGYQDEDGCPDEKPLAEVVGEEVRINQEIMFEKGKATIQPESMKVVDAVAKVLKDHPELQLVEVGGHASKEGDEYFNRTLTANRVKAVAAELVKAGVDEKRLISTGYGFYCPKVAGETEDALAKNRRVEFKILFRAGKSTGQKTGCEAADKKGVKAKVPEKPVWTGEAKPAAAPSTKPQLQTAKPAAAAAPKPAATTTPAPATAK